MASQVIYTSEKDLRNKIMLRHYIPYRVKRNSKYEADHIYFNDYWGQMFKVIDVDYDKSGLLNYANIRWEDGCYGLFCTELTVEDYIMKPDYRNIHKRKDIVNDNKIYTGAEIVYWFYTHDIDQFNHKYEGYWKWVDLFSDRRVQDYNHYKLYGKETNQGNYVNCRVIRVK